MIQLVCADSMTLMRSMVERVKPSWNMIFLDPPFFEWADKKGSKPNHRLLSQYVLQLLKPDGVVWLCGTQPQLSEDYVHWKRFFRVVFELIQYKGTGTPPINRWQPIRVHENIWCMIRDDAMISETHLDLGKVTKKGIKKTKGAGSVSEPMSIRYGGEWTEWRQDVGYPKSVFRCKQIKKSSKEYVGHPTQKPELLMELIIKMSTIEGDSILDPFAGSGTTVVEAEQLGRNCLAIELSREYCGLIWKRRKRAKRQAKLIL